MTIGQRGHGLVPAIHVSPGARKIAGPSPAVTWKKGLSSTRYLTGQPWPCAGHDESALTVCVNVSDGRYESLSSRAKRSKLRQRVTPGLLRSARDDSGVATACRPRPDPLRSANVTLRQNPHVIAEMRPEPSAPRRAGGLFPGLGQWHIRRGQMIQRQIPMRPFVIAETPRA
jgi:hypothetical protein